MSYTKKDTLQLLLIASVILLVICLLSKSKKRKDKKIIILEPTPELKKPDTVPSSATLPTDLDVRTVNVAVQQPPALVKVPVMSPDGSSHKEVTVAVQQPPKMVQVQVESQHPSDSSNRKGASVLMLPGLRFRENMSPLNLKFKKENMYVANKQELNNTGYTRSIENFDDEPVKSLNNLETTRTPVIKLPKKLLDNHEALRRSNADIPVDYLNKTFEDVLFDRETYGFDITDSTKSRTKLNEKARGSLSMDLLQLTDSADLRPDYGQMYGEVTMG
jgi:hypothetical protein